MYVSSLHAPAVLDAVPFRANGGINDDTVPLPPDLKAMISARRTESLVARQKISSSTDYPLVLHDGGSCRTVLGREKAFRSPDSRAHSPTFPSLHLRHSSFSNPSVALPTSQLILQPFRCFTCVTAHSPTLLSLLLRHRLFTYVT